MAVVSLLAMAFAGLIGVVNTPAASAESVHAAAAAGSPIGAIDVFSTSFDDAWFVSGWAADPDAPGSVSIQLYIAGSGSTVGVTGASRPDVAAAHPWAGPNTGFSFGMSGSSYKSAYGTGAFCLYAFNRNGGTSTLLGCRDMNAPAAPSPYNPLGRVDTATPSQGLLRLVGWAGDPDGNGLTRVRIYDNGYPLLQFSVSLPRPDVQAATPLGPWTGFDKTVPVYPGPHVFCLYAENTGRGTANTTIGCVSRTDPGVVAPGPHDPRGNYEPLVRGDCCSPQTLTPFSGTGWAFDPDSASPVAIVIRSVRLPEQYGFPPAISQSSTTTGIPRPDVQAAVPGAGPNTGFQGGASAPGPSYVVACAYATNVGPGTDRLLGCSWGFRP